MAEVLPAAFVVRMRERLGGEADAFFESLLAPTEGLRVNSLRADPDGFERIAPFEVARLPFPAEGFWIPSGAGAGRHPLHAAGLYYVQDPSAMAVGALADARPGERVLDLAAAPGGKATHLAARMRNAGFLVANDLSRPRAAELARNLERFGVRNAIVTSESVERLSAHFGAYFDRVLVDAPCSGESMFHKSAAAREDWSPEGVAGCARRQIDLLGAAANLVREGGLLIYSTCTFAEDENEEVAARFLSDAEQFELAPLASVPGSDQVEISGSGSRGGAIRFWPHRYPGAGHFVVAFRRVGTAERASAIATPASVPRLSADLAGHLEAFNAAFCPDLELRSGRVVQLGSELVELPEGAPSTRGLSVVRSGLWLGTLKPGRFEPSHALALAVPPDAWRDRLELSEGDPRVDSYLTGHTIESSGPPGWLPISFEGHALGWGKRVGRTIKNHYPRGLRWKAGRG